jgi:perosamine synthetase
MKEQAIPFHRPSIGPEELEAVRLVLESKWLATGPVTMKFEQEFAEFVDSKYAIAVNSCTAALHLALDSIGIKPGDEVLIPTYTFAATGEVVTYFGAHPILCDSIPGGFNIDPADVLRRITAKTRAIIAVHIAGEPSDLGALRQIANEHSLYLIEDAAHALPATYAGQKIGSISDLTAFSFYATKTITTGEGGMLTTNNPEYAKRASVMRLHGINGDAWKRYTSEGSWYYEIVAAGFKANMPDLLAALGLAQLKKANIFHQRRCEIADTYIQRFSQVDELELPPLDALNTTHSWHLFILRLKLGSSSLDRGELIKELKRQGIGTSVHFIPLHLHPHYRDRYGYKPGEFPCAEDAYSRCISLPIYPDMTDDDVTRVAASVEQYVTDSCRRLRVTAVETRKTA